FKVHVAGTRHSILSEEGCLVLAIYERQGRFLSSGVEGHNKKPGTEHPISIPAPVAPDSVSESIADGALLAVNGTLMRGLELNPNLLAVGAKFIRDAITEPKYRLWSIDDRHPAMVRVCNGGVGVAVEVWSVPTPGITTILRQEPPGL